MNDITTLPTSVRHRMEEAERLASSGRAAEAQQLAREAGRTLATTYPEACAVILAAEYGYRGLAATVTETTIKATRTDHVVLGVRVGGQRTRTEETRIVTKKLELY